MKLVTYITRHVLYEDVIFHGNFVRLNKWIFLYEKLQPLGSNREYFGAWDKCSFMGGGRLREVAAHEGLTLCLMRRNKSTMIKKICGGGGIFLFLFSYKGPLVTWCDLQLPVFTTVLREYVKHRHV